MVLGVVGCCWVLFHIKYNVACGKDLSTNDISRGNLLDQFYCKLNVAGKI